MDMRQFCDVINGLSGKKLTSKIRKNNLMWTLTRVIEMFSPSTAIVKKYACFWWTQFKTWSKQDYFLSCESIKLSDQTLKLYQPSRPNIWSTCGFIAQWKGFSLSLCDHGFNYGHALNLLRLNDGALLRTVDKCLTISTETIWYLLVAWSSPTNNTFGQLLSLF